MLLRKEPWLRKLKNGSEEPQKNHSGVHIFQLFDKHYREVSFQNHNVQTMTAFHLSHSHPLTVDEMYDESIFCSLMSNTCKENLG